VKVLVTGASSGIGAATAIALAERGDTVGIVARREDRLAEVLERCRKTSPESQLWAADLGDLDALDGLVARIDDELGGIDVLINNAGVPKRRRARAITPEDVEAVMAMNYFSPVRLTLALLPRLIERGSGQIVNVSSMGVHSAAFGVGAYSASKAALELFTESLFLELTGTGVRAQVFVPGSTLSEFSDDKPGNDPSMARDPSQFSTSEDVAAAIVRALDDERFIVYVGAREEGTSAAKNKDPNAFLANAKEALRAYL
jgi:short-subunit dehydrogenase